LDRAIQSDWILAQGGTGATVVQLIGALTALKMGCVPLDGKSLELLEESDFSNKQKMKFGFFFRFMGPVMMIKPWIFFSAKTRWNFEGHLGPYPGPCSS
jgi:hypothetical protein